MIKYLFSLILIFILPLSTSLANLSICKWEEVEANFEVKVLDTDIIPLGQSLLYNAEKILGNKNKYLEQDKKSILAFRITYPALVIKQDYKDVRYKSTIIQYGIFKALPKELQTHLNNTEEQTVLIQYSLENLYHIRFVIGKKIYDIPQNIFTTDRHDNWND